MGLALPCVLFIIFTYVAAATRLRRAVVALPTPVQALAQAPGTGTGSGAGAAPDNNGSGGPPPAPPGRSLRDAVNQILVTSVALSVANLGILVNFVAWILLGGWGAWGKNPADNALGITLALTWDFIAASQAVVCAYAATNAVRRARAAEARSSSSAKAKALAGGRDTADTGTGVVPGRATRDVGGGGSKPRSGTDHPAAVAAYPGPATRLESSSVAP